MVLLRQQLIYKDQLLRERDFHDEDYWIEIEH
jgi:hypothetical protein